MKPEEAIKILKYNSNVIHKTINGETDINEVKALDMAISALEKQIPKKPIEAGALLFYRCPICKKLVNDYGRYCVVCGCKLDWSEDE